MRAALKILFCYSIVFRGSALVPYPKSWKKATSSVICTLHPREFELATSDTFLINGVRKRISDWFRLPDDFINYPVNPAEGQLKSIKRLKITVDSNSTKLTQGVDESYSLSIPENCHNVSLHGKTVFGALHGLETFAQLFQFGWIEDGTGLPTFTLAASHEIEDAPFYPYRGLLIDTSRHYLPMELLMANLDAMAMNKLNVLHWHMTDSVSWPYASDRYPELADKGAYRRDMVYSSADIRRIVKEAFYRGIRVVPEFDLPGHSASIGKSHPEWMSHCPDWSEPIDPTHTGVYDFLKDLFTELFHLFPSDMFHLGGDEVPLDCWKRDPSIQKWMKSHNVSDEIQLFEIFETKLLGMFHTEKQPIVWQEIFDLGINISDNTVIDVWKGDKDQSDQSTVFNATANGHHVVISSCWYLDHLSQDWRKLYDCDLHAKLVNGTAEQASLILGGKASMWGEHVDASNFISRVWPRASAVAERLWSGNHQYNSTSSTIQKRISEFRCYMVQRGIDAGPVGPGFCAKEIRFQKNDDVQRSRLQSGSLVALN